MKKLNYTLPLAAGSLALLLGASLSCYEGAPVPPHDFAGDSTSHAFAWERESVGDGNGSVLYDAAIVNDTLAYAVGVFSIADSNGGFTIPPFNLARWNGSLWSYAATADSGYAFSPLWSVFAFAPDDIWAGSTVPEHWDGHRWTFYGPARGYAGTFPIRRMWGSSSRDLYAAGDGGHISHFNGTAWRDLQTGTTLDFRDISGAWDLQANGWQILAVASASPRTSTERSSLSRGKRSLPSPTIPYSSRLRGSGSSRTGIMPSREPGST